MQIRSIRRQVHIGEDPRQNRHVAHNMLVPYPPATPARRGSWLPTSDAGSAADPPPCPPARTHEVSTTDSIAHTASYPLLPVSPTVGLTACQHCTPTVPVYLRHGMVWGQRAFSASGRFLLLCTHCKEANCVKPQGFIIEHIARSKTTISVTAFVEWDIVNFLNPILNESKTLKMLTLRYHFAKTW